VLSEAIDYESFVASKRRAEVATGHAPGALNEHLFDFQHAIVSWAVRRGRAAIFADTGLGKTLMQLSWADEVATHTGGMVLVLAPLAVSEQTIEQGSTFGIEVRRVPHGGTPDAPGVWITNYERMDAIDFSELHGLVLDESSILKAHDGKTRQRIIDAAQGVPYRLSCTATPSPNDFDELGNQCEFLGVMSRTEMLATYFVNDTGDTGTWRLKGWGASKFWQWMGTWSVVLRNPSDLGFNGARYELPAAFPAPRRSPALPPPAPGIQGRRTALPWCPPLAAGWPSHTLGQRPSRPRIQETCALRGGSGRRSCCVPLLRDFTEEAATRQPFIPHNRSVWQIAQRETPVLFGSAAIAQEPAPLT